METTQIQSKIGFINTTVHNISRLLVCYVGNPVTGFHTLQKYNVNALRIKVLDEIYTITPGQFADWNDSDILWTNIDIHDELKIRDYLYDELGFDDFDIFTWGQ